MNACRFRMNMLTVIQNEQDLSKLKINWITEEKCANAAINTVLKEFKWKDQLKLNCIGQQAIYIFCLIKK